MRKLPKYEAQIIVIKFKHDYFYTLELRRIWFLFRGRWIRVSPQYQTSYDEAFKLMNKYNETRTIFS